MKPFLPPEAPKAVAPRLAAFTLHELLVVIALVALVMVLAFGGYSRLREKGVEAQCISNLRTLGVVLTQYASDHRGLYPAYYEMMQGKERSWGEQLIRRHYLQSPEALFCPAITPRGREVATLTDPFPAQTNLAFGEMTYGMRTRLPAFQDNNAGDKSGYRVARIGNLAQFMLMTDSLRTVAGGTAGCFRYDWGTRAWSGVDFRHSGKANALFADGHVAGVDRAAYVDLLRQDSTYNLRPAYWNGTGFSILQ